jgi:hypothetical protein
MIARAIVREAQHCEEPLLGFALSSPKHPLSNRSIVGAEAEPRLDRSSMAFRPDPAESHPRRNPLRIEFVEAPSSIAALDVPHVAEGRIWSVDRNLTPAA